MLTWVCEVLSGSPHSSESWSGLCWSSCALAGWRRKSQELNASCMKTEQSYEESYVAQTQNFIWYHKVQKHGPWSGSSSLSYMSIIWTCTVNCIVLKLTCSRPSGRQIYAMCRTAHPACGKHSRSRCRTGQRDHRERASGGSVCSRSAEWCLQNGQ